MILLLALGCDSRPSPQNRTFSAEGIQEVVAWGQQNLKPEYAKMFSECFPNSADTTIFQQEGNRTYVITGDIPAMWLRDSCNQVMPYLKYSSKDPKVKRMILNLVAFQAKLVMAQPYANAFLSGPRSRPSQNSDVTTRLFYGRTVRVNQKFVWERKYEIDSLAYFLKLVNTAYATYHDLQSILTADLLRALRSVANLIEEQLIDKQLQNNGSSTYYNFKRNSIQLDHNGNGMPGVYCGLIRSGFRPSDDRVLNPYNIPGNILMQKQLQNLTLGLLADAQTQFPKLVSPLLQRFNYFKLLLSVAVKRHGNASTQFGTIFVQESNGEGLYTVGDDPNLPSLMSLVEIGYSNITDPLYANTKKFLYSAKNQFFYSNRNGTISGLGSTHTPKNYIWPIGIMSRILASSDQAEVKYCLDMLVAQGPLMHESFDVSNPSAHTRDWFAWANSMFGEVVVQLSRGPFKHLILR